MELGWQEGEGTGDRVQREPGPLPESNFTGRYRGWQEREARDKRKTQNEWRPAVSPY
jgi:hypothetical protein